MTKELATDILHNYLKDKKRLPIFDERITSSYENGVMTEWTFRGLLNVLLDL
jgi:hypothetical protein